MIGAIKFVFLVMVEIVVRFSTAFLMTCFFALLLVGAAALLTYAWLFETVRTILFGVKRGEKNGTFINGN